LTTFVSGAHQQISQWSDQKAELKLITSTKKYKLRNIYLNGKVQSYQDNITYLGILIDNKTNWAEHCKIKARKALTSFMQCKRAIGTNNARA